MSAHPTHTVGSHRPAPAASAAERRQRDHASSLPGGITSTGRLRHGELSQGHRTLTVFLHLSPLGCLIGLFPLALLGPLVLWLVGRERSAFVDDHGREAINFMLSFFVLHLALGLTVIGLALWPVLWVVAAVNVIRAAVAAGQGEYFRYPITIRFLP